MAEALINNKILSWAAERAGLPLGHIAKKVNVKPEVVEAWLAGDSRPTFRQAQMLATALHVPFGYFFLTEPPEDDLPIPDLRTVGGDPARRLDVNFKDLLADILFKRDWYRDFLDEHDGEHRGFVGRFTVNADTKEVADDIRLTLFGEDGPPQAGSWEEYLRLLMGRAEEAGIWVMRNGIVGSNTHRPLSVQQFRGFAISDPVIPLIFINGKDAKAAQIFTLAHELAHLWLGESGISNVFIGESDYGVHRKLERKCNEIAAEFLVPEAGFAGRWRADDSLSGNADRLARYYRVSRIVIARRAFDLNIISEADYRAFYALESSRWKAEASDSSGGSFYNTLPVRNGGRFTRSVVNQALSGRLLLKHAASLLNTQPASLVKFGQQVRVA
ncbi:ImmA/IrrE family metallo-endopeptidase [Aquamicrobium sp.]|uniref:ImmA/IrrE family metallo-endopeptidase n=1 Tax=Aquamicrobium sp. TaxID=1872579 RepID=UPI0025845609|nr:ImmA/IrrE family metallo-endopeptidase [Aquamicrobium sp.]MCK9551238.1 ImmA/IrrE family metallo-endopeptidase [Aquamicrobium sp.]